MPLQPKIRPFPERHEPTPEEIERHREQRELARRREFEAHCSLMWSNFIERRGRRYKHCTLLNYDASTPDQEQVVTELQKYLREFDTNVDAGSGVVLFGPTGTGKDHLLTALCRYATEERGFGVTWRNGLDLYGEIRSAIQNNSEEDLVTWFTKVKLLAISDSLPPAGELTSYQASVLFRILDHRYSHMRPVWLTLNVASADEAKSRLTIPVVDRLRDCCLTLHCNWPSYRGTIPPNAEARQ